jgi:hypothetical protein
MTTTESKTLAKVGAMIYESPDGGKTIYARERRSSIRKLVSEEDAETVRSIALGKWQLLITKIVPLSYTVPALADQLEKLKELYLLVKNEDD